MISQSTHHIEAQVFSECVVECLCVCVCVCVKEREETERERECVCVCVMQNRAV